jgi:hypothetical protein
MRKTLLVGLVLAVAAMVVVWVSAAFDLELESVVLLGVGVGAVIALVPDRTPLARLTGFVGGFVAAWVGYVLRAAVLPDSAGGRAVAVGLVIALAVVLAAAGLGRIPLWSTLLGAGALAGAYEYTYAAAPPEVASTSLSSATALLLTVAVGFLATALVAPDGEEIVPSAAWAPKRRDTAAVDRLDDLMMGENQ